MRRLMAALLLGAALSAAGQISLGPQKPTPYVTSQVEPKTIVSHRQEPVRLLFRVEDGFHINSHTPRNELLIPTQLKLDAVQGLTVGKIAYPRGQLYSFSFEPKEKLDVYTGELTIVVPVRAAKAGTYTLHGELRYQACDNASCYPPQTLPVAVEITVR